MNGIRRNTTPVLTGLGILVLAGALGAQKVEVKAERDPDADFTAFKTYAWLPPLPAISNIAPDAVGNPTLTGEALGPHIVEAVDRQLTMRGLTKVDGATADVHVAYFAALTTGVAQSFLGEHYGYITGWGPPIAPGLAPSTSMMVHEKGTVVIDIVQRATNRGIWHGSMVTRINQEHTLEKRIARINEGTQRLFERFPIRPRK